MPPARLTPLLLFLSDKMMTTHLATLNTSLIYRLMWSTDAMKSPLLFGVYTQRKIIFFSLDFIHTVLFYYNFYKIFCLVIFADEIFL